MTDRIVHACGCSFSADATEPGGWYRETGGQYRCLSCGQPVTAVNLDRLLRLEARVPVVCDECGGRGEVADTSKTDHPHGLVGYANKPCPTCHGTGAVWKQTVQKEGK